MNTTMLPHVMHSQATAPSDPMRPPDDTYFRHHGVWAPGVRLFRRLGFRVKAGLISLVLLLPLVLLAGALWHTKQASIEFTRKEQLGAAAMQDFARFLHALTQVRNAVRAGMGNKLDTHTDLEAAQKTADDALATMLEHLQQSHDPMGLSASVNNLEAAWRKACTIKGGVDQAGRTVFGPVVGSAQEVMVRLGDDSNLVLDPEVASYYLINAMVLTMPNAIERVGQVWGWSAYAESRGALEAHDQGRLIAWLSQSQGDVRDLRTYIGRAAKADPSVGSRINLSALDATEAFLKHVQTTTVDSNPVEPAVLYAEGKAAVEGMNQLYDQTLPLIGELLTARVKEDQRQVWIFSLVVGLSVMLGLYMFYAFYLVMRGGLLEVERHLDGMAGGDLTTHPAPWGTDEVARLMNSLGRMQHAWRGIVGQVRETSDVLVVAGGQLREAATDLAARTEQSASNLERSASALEQTGVTAKETAEKVAIASDIASRNADTARSAGTAVGELVSTMEQIQNSSQRIGQIIGTIDRIAFQTNLLSLNAAVEAARAGQHGRGFGVVATEIRALAGLCANAAREIKTLVSGSVTQVNMGTQTVQQASDTILTLVKEVAQINGLLSEVAVAAREQSQGVAAVGQAVHEIDSITHQNARLADNTRDAAAALEAQSLELAENFHRFKVSSV